MSWQQYFEKNKGRVVRPLYLKAIEQIEPKDDCRVAVDLGCGAGIEAADLISRGWNVIAIDREAEALNAVQELVRNESLSKLELRYQAFEDIQELPTCKFFFAYHSLPFCRPDRLSHLWSLISNCLLPGGIFAGSFFGTNDEWVQAGRATGVSLKQLELFLSDFDITDQEEVDRIGPTALSSPKHWHFIDLIAVKKG